MLHLLLLSDLEVCHNFKVRFRCCVKWTHKTRHVILVLTSHGIDLRHPLQEGPRHDVACGFLLFWEHLEDANIKLPLGRQVLAQHSYDQCTSFPTLNSDRVFGATLSKRGSILWAWGESYHLARGVVTRSMKYLFFGISQGGSSADSP